jgi:hypothetical protein
VDVENLIFLILLFIHILKISIIVFNPLEQPRPIKGKEDP